jgi:hypothetical protein
VEHDSKADELGARIAKIENGELTIERDSVTLTTYHVRNGGEQPAKVMMKHARVPKARLASPPEGTEDNLGTGSALVPITVAPHTTADLVVDERLTFRKSGDWFSPIADTAINAYLANPKADRDTAKRLAAAWVLRNDYLKKYAERTSLKQQAYTASQETEEARRDLRSTERGGGVDTLRQNVAAHLAEASARLADLNRKMAELDGKLAGLNVRFDVAIHDVSF